MYNYNYSLKLKLIIYYQTCAGEETGLLKDKRKDFLNVLLRLNFSMSSVTTTSMDSLLTLPVGVTIIGVEGVFGESAFSF